MSEEIEDEGEDSSHLKIEHRPHRRTISIVLREADDGQGFALSMEGDMHRIGKVANMQLTPIEGWAKRLFDACGRELRKQGGVRRTVR